MHDPNLFAEFLNPLRREDKMVSLETVHVGLVCLAVLIALCNVIGWVLS